MTHQFCLTFQCWTWCSGQSWMHLRLLWT
jgi:hypothetical protein